MSHIITRPTRELPVRGAARLSGHVTVELIHAATGLVKRRLRFGNLLVDAGLDALAGARLSTLSDWCAVGTGSAAPAADQTALVTEVERTNDDGGIAGSGGLSASGNYAFLRRTREFLEGEANANLTEVAFFDQDAPGGTMWMRQLFEDAAGNPTTITKTSDDRLRVIYEVRLYPNQTVNSQQIEVGGAPIDVDSRAYDIDHPDGWIAMGAFGDWHAEDSNDASQSDTAFEDNTMPALTDAKGGTQRGSTGHNSPAYVAGSFTKEREVIWDPGVANFATGVGALLYGARTFNAGGFLASKRFFISTFDPKIPKTDTDRLVIQWQVTWSRAVVDDTAH